MAGVDPDDRYFRKPEHVNGFEKCPVSADYDYEIGFIRNTAYNPKSGVIQLPAERFVRMHGVVGIACINEYLFHQSLLKKQLELVDEFTE